ncbi:hypothetical protein LNO78_28900 [Klebsiella pneumoniae subsp. pneumoniae]|nr:hypothetical protein [Klebsiella pneumoniae subsp. pneumoniae]
MGLQSDEDEGNWVYKQPDTFEDAIDLTGQILSLVRKESLIPAEAPIVIVYDSLASMVPRQKFEKFEKMADGTAKEKDELNMNDNMALARATSANLPTLAKWAQKYNACLIFLDQVRTKMGVMFGALPLPRRRLSEILRFRPHQAGWRSVERRRRSCWSAG